MLRYSSNNRYIGLGRMPTPRFSQAWFDFKAFMTSASPVGPGWTVSQSGYSNSAFGSAFGAGDLLVNPDYSAGGMASDVVWFVLRDPLGVRELLFYRHLPIDTSSNTGSGSKTSYRSASQMAIAYSAQSKFSTTLGQGYNLVTYPSTNITSVNSIAGTAVLNIAGVGPENVGNTVTIVGGSASAKNNGTYYITAVTSSTITIANALASIDTTGNISVDIRKLVPVTASNPPMAIDMVWLHRDDLFDSNKFYVNTLGPTDDVITWAGSTDTGDALNDYDIWNMHIGADDAAPYPFYFWFTGRKETLGFFAMDATLETNAGDPENVVFWFCPVTGGIGGYPTLNYDVINGASMTANQWSPHYIEYFTNLQKPRLRAWINKPSMFSNRNDFINKMAQNTCRFLPVTVPMLTTLISDDQPSGLGADENFYSFAPQGNSTSLYSSQDQLFPVLYFKYTAVQSKNEIDSGPIGSNGLALPNTYKGKSVLLKMNSVIRKQFDTITISTPKDGIICGSCAEFVLPWSSVSINKP